MKSKFPSPQVLLAVIIVLISTTSNSAQNLHHDWTKPGLGTITNLQKMTVQENGDRYVAEDGPDVPEGGGFDLAKYNDHGELVWRKPYVPEYPGNFVAPLATAYNAGAVYVIGDGPGAYVNIIKFSDDDGSTLDETSIGGGFGHRSAGIVADPLGTGVIVNGLIRFTDPVISGERRYMMFAVKYDADLNRVWPVPLASLGQLVRESTQNPEPTPRMITADADGSIYVTGVLDVEGAPVPPYRTSAASAFTLKFTSDGVLDWFDKTPPETSITNFGYDTDYDATGTYTVYQSVSTHLVDAPLSTGMTVLTKRNLDGSHWPPNLRPSRVRDLSVPFYGGTSVHPDVLVVDKLTSSAYIAYDEVSPSSVAVEKFDASGIRRWIQHISIGASTSIQSVVLDRSGNIVVGVNNDAIGKYAIFVFGPDGSFIDNIEITGQILKQLVVDYHNHIHAICTISGSTTSYFISRFSYEIASEFTTEPELLRPIEGFGLDLYAHGIDECWTGPLINWDCLTPPFCDSPKEMKSSLMIEDKTVWESKFIQPFNTAFPQSKDFRTFSLKVNDGQVFQEVLLIDDNLVKNGVTQLSFKTISIDHSVSLNIATNGAQVPITVSFLNSQGKELGNEQFMAPFQKQLSEKFNEPVASISINGPKDKISFNYYPNPSSGAFTVEVDEKLSLPVELAVYDMQGFQVHQQMLKESKTAVSLSGKKPGLYVLLIKNGTTEIRELIQVN